MGSTSQNGICIKTNTAHLICLGNSRLSTEVTIFEIPIGNLTIGSKDSCDIVLKGTGVSDVHCRCSRKLADGEDETLGEVTIEPIESSQIYVEGVLITDERVLQQGDLITLGDSIFLRFNFPARAALLKNNAMDNSSKKSISNNYEVLKKTLNTSSVNFTEFSNNTDKTLNNNVKITDKMKSLKLKANDSYPNKISNLQVFPILSPSKSIENCQANGNIDNANLDEMQQLEDVLKIFVEYNNNNNNNTSSTNNQSSRNNISVQTSSSEKINVTHQNRIKTNGSLPKNFHTAKDNAYDYFDNDSTTATDIEMYKKPQSPRTRIKTFVSSPTSDSSTIPPIDNDKSYEQHMNGIAVDKQAMSSNEKDYEKLIKSFEEKFRMDIYNIQHCESQTDVPCDTVHLTDLNSAKNDILAKIRELKILISDIYTIESETFLESDVEKSLVLAEMSNESSSLTILNEKLQTIKAKMKQLEVERMKRQKQQEIQQIQLKNIIRDKEAEIKMLEDQKEVSVHSENRLDELHKSLESDIKSYEDLEFHYLEEETEWASLIEEYKDNINTFTKQIEDKRTYLHHLEQTKRENENSTQTEQKTLEKKLFNLKQKLENEREKLKNIDKLLSIKGSPEPMNNSTDMNQFSKSKSFQISNLSSAFDDDLSSHNNAINNNSNTDNNQSDTKVVASSTTDLMSKSFNENMFFNRSKIEVSFFDFSTATESLPRNSKIASPERKQVSSVAPKRVTETDHNNSPLQMPKYHSLSSINYSNDNLSFQPNHSHVLINGHSSANNRTEENRISTTLSRNVQLRSCGTKQKRPLTQFLPNFRLDFNLRSHIESAGHQIQLCPHVSIDATSCRGYLNKVGSKPLFSNLRANTRWFVFDREKQMFVYYSDKNEKKPRGGAYFNAISDVYFDHSASKRTFIVKTKSRAFTLQAPSSQACSIWIDVLITGAQGKIFEYEKYE